MRQRAGRLEGKIPKQAAAQIGWIQAILPAPYFAHVQFSPPDTILALPEPGDAFPFVKAMWHYARGAAFAAKSDVERARQEAVQIAEINQRTGSQYPPDLAPVAPDVLRIARHVVKGRIAQAQNDLARAIKEFRIAVTIQDALPYHLLSQVQSMYRKCRALVSLSLVSPLLSCDPKVDCQTSDPS